MCLCGESLLYIKYCFIEMELYCSKFKICNYYKPSIAEINLLELLPVDIVPYPRKYTGHISQLYLMSVLLQDYIELKVSTDNTFLSAEGGDGCCVLLIPRK